MPVRAVPERAEQVGGPGVMADSPVGMAAGPCDMPQDGRGDRRALPVFVHCEHAAEQDLDVVEIALPEGRCGGDQQGVAQRAARGATVSGVDDGGCAVRVASPSPGRHRRRTSPGSPPSGNDRPASATAIA